jgi:hypothetical protein
MSKVTPGLLNDTLNMIQLARETALAGGKADQANRLTPVVNEMRHLVNSSHEVGPATTPNPATPTSSAVSSPAVGVMRNNDFQTLLNAVSRPVTTSPASSPAVTNSMEKNMIVSAMAHGGMAEIDIARQMGMTRDEVQMILSIHGS